MRIFFAFQLHFQGFIIIIHFVFGQSFYDIITKKKKNETTIREFFIIRERKKINRFMRKQKEKKIFDDIKKITGSWNHQVLMAFNNFNLIECSRLCRKRKKCKKINAHMPLIFFFVVWNEILSYGKFMCAWWKHLSMIKLMI